jgi:hypothetical protein
MGHIEYQSPSQKRTFGILSEIKWDREKPVFPGKSLHIATL